MANRDIDFEIPRHSIVAIIGPNGAGKTTFFNQLSGVYHPTSGTIEFEGIDISGLAPHLVAGLGIARTYQNIRLFQNMTVLNNVMVGRHVRMRGQWSQAITGLGGIRQEEEATRRRAFELMELVGSRAAWRPSCPRTCRTATSAVSRSRVRWPATRSCCSLTSRPPA